MVTDDSPVARVRGSDWLETRVADARGNEAGLDHAYLAWHGLLALFRVVHQGVTHLELRLIAHDGSLFDPAPARSAWTRSWRLVRKSANQ